MRKNNDEYSHQTFLEVEAEWKRFEEKMKSDSFKISSINSIPLPTQPETTHPTKFGYFGDVWKMVRKMCSKGEKRKARRLLITLYLRYHPDKMGPRIAKLVPEEDTNNILGELQIKAKAITQALTALKSELASLAAAP
mmetsp:Transcript_25112/g.44645  ORF Transcript_25112/g.44645 Transcript_25112/m.44645 type:complete len:138 (+) Transcript_25112:1270-1683(+)